MNRLKTYINTCIFFLTFLLFVGFETKAQLTAKVGETTKISISEVSGDTYAWELYDMSENVNFAVNPGNCPKSKAYFVDDKTLGESVQVKWLATGEYFYKVRAQGSCANNVKVGRVVVVEADVPPPPKIAVSYDCERGVAELTASNYQGDLIWSTGETAKVIEVKISGVYTLKQTLNGQESPAARVQVVSIRAEKPVNVTASPSKIIKGTSAKLEAEGCDGGQLHWYSDKALTQKLTNTKVSPEKTTTYYVVCESEAGCVSAYASVNVVVESEIPPSPKVEVIYDCENGFATLTAREYVGAILWSTGETSSSIKVKNAGNYTVVQTVDGQQSAETQVSVKSTKAESPSNVKASPSEIQKGDTAFLTADGCDGGELHWYSDKALTQKLINTKVSPDKTTTYYVVCENEAGCVSAYASVNVVVESEIPPSPKVEVIYDCENGFATLTAREYVGVILWSTGETSSSIKVKNAGNYTVVQTVDGQQSAETQVSVKSTKAESPSNVKASPSEIQKGDTAFLTADGCDGGELHWYSDKALTQKLTKTKVSPDKTTTYYVVCESEAGCVSAYASVTVVVKIEIPTTPSIEVFYDCSTASARLKASGYTGSLLWSTGEASEEIQVKKGGTYTLVQIVNGMESSPASVEVKDDILPRVNLIVKAQPPIIEEGGKSQLVADGCPENSTLVWYADEALTKELGSTTVSPEETTTYYAVCVNEIGCASSPEKVTVTVEPFDDLKCKNMYKSITIEQLISPNGDGLNDTWELQDVLKYCNECGKTARVKLFNRWGAKVYEKDGYMLDSERFDGYSSNKLDYQNSKLLPDGTYFYVIIVKGEKEKTGYINIVTER